MKVAKFRSVVFWICLVFVNAQALARINALHNKANEALKQAMVSLGHPTNPDNLICLTNTGYAMVQGEGTLTLCKTTRDVCGI